MNYGLYQILGIVAVVCSCYNATIHTLPYDAKKGIQSCGTESGNSKNETEAVPEDALLQKTLLRNPRYDVSVIYLKIQDYQILCIVNLVLIFPIFIDSHLVPLHCNSHKKVSLEIFFLYV